MIDPLEKKLSMYYTVSAFFNAHLPDLSVTQPRLTNQYSEYIDLLTQLETQLTKANLKNTGYAEQKKVLRLQCRNKTIELANVLKAFFLIQKDELMVQKVSISNTDFNLRRESELHYLCDAIYEIAMNHLTDLASFGYTPAKIAEVPESYQAFKNFILQPSDERHKSAKANMEATLLFKQVDDKLAIIDALMAALTTDFEMLVKQYRLDRMING